MGHGWRVKQTMKKSKGKRKAKPQVRITPYSAFKLYNLCEHGVMIDAETDLVSLFLAVCHSNEGFGKDRLKRVYDEMLKTAECVHDRLITYRQIENELDIEAGVGMNTAESKARARERDRIGQLQEVATVRTSDIFLWALRNSESFGHDRLTRVYEAAAQVSNEVCAGKTTYADCYAEVRKTGFDFKITMVF